MQTAYVIEPQDNVATALDDLEPGEVTLLGQTGGARGIVATGEVRRGHKLALRPIREGEDVVKYAIRIGRAMRDIAPGEWVHLHNIHSVYDERSSHLDAVTGAPMDTKYE
ncbi:SAF protein [Bifidobacterium sp. DSM 109958]|uniref:SAF protein n=1 Tax=Bifidobacterium moraviense TaxID=2675323 RepID=A0A7Y0F123_9BIFI|nr:UxaA family hydrolase [Bifidobacterium sp. DSM 109958]NMN00060.1 SAF protein [Bifidobacterium sp. DSM 109958]